mmetsp:Transcript_94065/g.280731  ORF Transcript_94065/g.280731 Transcript_94065/m.280731 type:complete len:217 (+) Transcript_94065:281-931(+)
MRSCAPAFRPSISITWRTNSCPRKAIRATALCRCRAEASAPSASSPSPPSSCGGVDCLNTANRWTTESKSSPLKVLAFALPWPSPLSPSSIGNSGQRAFNATTTSVHSLKRVGCSRTLDMMIWMALWSSSAFWISTALKRSCASDMSGLAPSTQSSLSNIRTVQPQIVSPDGQMTTCSTSSAPKLESSALLGTAALPPKKPTHSGLTPSSSARRMR